MKLTSTLTLFLLGVLFTAKVATAASASYVFQTINIPVSIDTASVDNAVAINDYGRIVGGYTYDNGHAGFDHRAFVYDNGKITSFNEPQAFPDTTRLFGINNAGQIVGSFLGPATHRGDVGFLYSNGSFTIFNAPGALVTGLQAINNVGQITGSYVDFSFHNQAFVYKGGVFTNVDPPNYKPQSSPAGINDFGQMVGGEAGPQFPSEYNYLYSQGVFTRINVPLAPESVVNGINNKGQIIGGYFEQGTGTEHGFVDTNGSFTMLDVPGGHSTAPDGINNLGQIVGTYTPNGSLWSSIFIATPVPTPEPGSLMLLVAGVIGIIMFRRCLVGLVGVSPQSRSSQRK